MKNIYCLLLFVLLISCSHNANVDKKQIVFYDSIIIKSDYPYLTSYANNVLFMENNNLILGCYNHSLHQIDFFDITEKRIKNFIPLDKEGRNRVNNVSNLMFDSDNIIIRDLSDLIYLSYDGKVEKK